MKNQSVRIAFAVIAAIFGAVLLTTCTVGLGDSVDTKAPAVSITYPPVQSIIKNTFTLRGTASDDNELVGVRVTITNTDTDEVFDGYQATVDKATNTWSFVANRRGGDGAFELPDGNYQVIARAVDGANRQTVASTTLEIDNTAPVLVLNRPGTKGPLASTNPEVYGSELRLTGSANDDHALDLLTMRVYSAGGTLIGEPLTYANVSGVGMDILLAKHYETPADEEQQALRDRYLSIYNAAAGGTQEFYCLVDISDYAREYEPPADVASADNTRGNVSRAYWLYDDIYSRVFDKSGFALTMSDLTSVLSGRYASVTTAEEVKTYLAENQQDSTVWSETAVTFSLDPENSPYYEVIGYTALATSETITAQASNGTNLTVRVSAGRDRKPLRPETIRVFLDPSNANGAELAGDGDNILLLPSVAELGGDAAAIAVRNEQLSKTGDDYVISVNVGTLVNGNYYLVKVEGEDQAGYEITDAKGKYGFQIIASGNPPVLTVTAPEDLSYWNGDSVFFEGTVDAEGGLASLTANVTITATSGGTIVRNNEPQTITIVPDAENPDTWSFTLDTVTGILTNGLYMAEVYIEAADLQNKRTPQIIRLYIDKDPPHAEITRVEPYYFYDSGTSTYTINGTVAVTLSMTDNDQLVSLAYDIGTIVTQPETPVSTPVDNRTISVNTSSILVPANLPVTVTLQDRAGNNATISLPDTLYVDQSTDKPVIELSNPASLAADQAGAQGNWITGSVISGTITDDDAIGSLQLNIYNTGGTIVKTRYFAAGDLMGTDRRKVLSYDISAVDANPALADGIYRLELTAVDDSAVASDVTEGWFSYDTTNPELIDVDTTPPGLTLANTGFTLSGEGYDANALRSTNPVVVKQRLGSGEKIPVPVAITVVDEQNCTWTIEDLPRVPTLAGIGGPVALDGSNDGLYEYEVTVFDQAGQFSVETVQVRLDSSAPEIVGITLPPEAPAAGNVVGTNTSFQGTAVDTAPSSGISEIRYSLDGSTWTPIAASTNWNTTHVFGGAEAEGSKTLIVVAEDSAGNESIQVTRNFVFDRASPTLSITGGTEQFADGEFSLAGTAYDTHGIDEIVVTQVNAGLISTGITIDASGAPDYGWEVTGLPRNPGDLGATLVADGLYTYEVHAVDAAGKLSTIATVQVTIDTTAPEINTITNPDGATGVSALSGTTYQFRGNAADVGVGVAKIWYQITQSATAPAVGTAPAAAGYTELATSGTWNFTRDLVDFTPAPAPGELSEGVGYYLHVLAEDASGNRTAIAASEEFDIDRSNPAVTETEVGVATMVNRRESFDLLGAVTDTHGIVSIGITQSLDGGTPIEITANGPVLTEVVPGEETAYDWILENLPRGNTAGTIGNPSTVNGTYEYQITTTDYVGKTHTIVRRIRFDSIGPDIEFTSPAAGGWQTSGDVTVTGLATDLTAVGGVYYSIEASAPTIPVAPDADADWTAEGWSVAGGTLGSWEIALTGLAQGSHGVWVSAMDTNGNTTAAIQRTFGVDTALPQLVGVSTPDANTNTGFALTGTATDTNALHPVTPVTITQSFNSGSAVTISGNISPDPASSGDLWTLASLPRNPASPLDQIAFDGFADGEYEFTITATDIAGKTYNTSRTVRIDTQAPTLTIPTAVEDTLTGWKRTPILPISGTVEETGSGMDRIEYSLNGGAVQALSLTYPNWSGNIPLANGTDQTLTITAYDKAGNGVTSATYTFSVDLDSPSITKITPTGQQLTNLGSSIESTYTVTDSGDSGIATVLVTSIGGTAIDADDQTFTSSSDTWTLTILQNTLADLDPPLNSDTAYTVTAAATDTAGNTSTAAFQIFVDTASPSVAISSPVNGATINKLTQIKGTANDARMLSKVELYVEDPVSGIIPATPIDTFDNGEQYNWSYDFDTDAWELAGGSGVASVRVIATDEAGNTATLDYAYTIDQESDRPRIRSSNVIFDDGDIDYPSTLQMTKNVIGTIEDDDGPVTSVEIWKKTSTDPDPEVWAWVPQTMSGISYTYQSYGDDGLKILRFRITDAEGEIFETGGALPPKFEWGTGGAGEYAYTERTYRVDTSIPDIMGTVYVHRTEGDIFTEAVPLTPNMAFGGTSSSYRLWIGADDDNGIATVEVTVPGATPETQTLDSDDIDQPGSITDFTVFRSGTFDISSVTDGALTINITVTDNSGLESYASRAIVIDNTVPDIEYSYPEHEVDQVFGNLTITGLASDDGSGLADIAYKIGYDYENQPTWNTATTSGATWSITDFAASGGGVRIENYTRQEVTDVDPGTDTLMVIGHGYADNTPVWIGADELPGGLDYGTPYYIRYVTDDTFQLAGSSGGATIDILTTGDTSVGVSSHAASAAGNIWYLPVMVRALDEAGNEYVTPEWDYRIKVDPSGDKPTAFVSYPDPDTTLAEPNPIVGGIIRMSGYAVDNVDVAAVYMQIDVDGDGDFTAADIDGEGVDWYNGGLGKEVTGSRNWTQTINTEGEFNPLSGTRRLIKYRIRAQDNNLLYGSWTDAHYFEIDEGVPKFSTQLTFEQGGRTRTYEPDMWLNGDWILTGTIMDESDIGEIDVGDTPGAPASQVIGTHETDGWFTEISSGTLYGYEMAIPVPTTTFTGSTSHSFTISATDLSNPPMTSSREIRINYDNTNPDITAAYGGSLPIRNSNGSYELNSSVLEAQSGFDRVMVVFHRPDGMTDGGRVYNPLSVNTYTEWDPVGPLTESSEGLPLMEYTSATRSNKTSLTLSGIDSDPYAREGYYLRIGGLYYRITNVTGDTITWEGDVDESITDFELVYAFAVDLMNTEVTDMDGDGIIEAVTRSGGTYYWSSSIDSTNLPDGQMNIRYVAFDKAGNFVQHADIVTRVENNPPLLAQVALATDLDGSGGITDGSGTTLDEWNPPYSLLAGGVEQKTATVTASDFTAKDFMEVVIDVVGGNGDLEYRLDVGGTTVHDLEEFNLRTGDYVEGFESTNTITVLRDDLVTIGEGAQSFVFSIWDSTETYIVGDSTDFRAVLTINLTVDVVDEVDPVTVVSPFFWNSATDNSLYANSRVNGHIELEDDLPAIFITGGVEVLDRDPKVSGQISIRGTAYDDQRLTALWMYVGDTALDGNFDFPKTAPVTVEKTIYGKTYYQMATYTPGSGWTSTASDMETNGWVFSVDDEYLDQTGHLVNWQLDWNTAELDTIAAVDRYVRVVAEDKRATPNPSSEDLASHPGDVTTNNVPYYRMDVVPYIQSIGSVLSNIKKNNPSVYNRTALGRYPVNEGETITVSGFNLGGDQSVSMAGQATGAFGITVNSITTLNNSNSETAEYNLLPNGDNNPHLTDDVYLDVWEFNDRAAVPISGRITDPVMKINPASDKLGFAFSNGPLYFSMGGTVGGTEYSYRYWQASYDFMTSIAFAYDSGGSSYGSAAGGDINSSSADKFTFMTSKWGLGELSNRGSYDGYHANRLETIAQNEGGVYIFNKNRIQSPSYVTSRYASNTNIYLAYFDDMNAEIRFRYGRLANNNTTKQNFGNFRDSETVETPQVYNNSRVQIIASESLAGRSPGQYVSLGVVPGTGEDDDTVVVVWFDATNNRMLYSYNDSATTLRGGDTTATGWSSPVEVFAGAGEYCQVAVDADGGIHMAAYDTQNADVVYAYLSTYDDTSPETCVVDSYGIVGTYITLDVAMVAGTAIPYIGYYSSSSVRPRHAYLVDTSERAPDGSIDEVYTGAWEIATLPTTSTVPQDRINTGVWKTAEGVLKNGTSGTSSYVNTGSGYTATSYGHCWGNGTSNAVLAYAIRVGTSGYIETAQKK